MNQHLKQRLVGALVIILLAVIFLPMFLQLPVEQNDAPTITEFDLSDTPSESITESREATVGDEIPAEVLEHHAQQIETPIKEKIVPIETPSLASKEDSSSEKIKPINKPEKSLQADHKTTSMDAINQAANSSKAKAVKEQWALQMGSFSSQENAQRLVQRLKSEKLSAYFEAIDSQGKTVYRVRVGPYTTKTRTEQMQRKLDQKERLKTLIVRID